MTGLEDLYREIILDHYRSPRNRGELDCPPARRVEGFNPLCGDEIVLYVEVDSEDNVANIAMSGQGCCISQSSASMMTAAVKGRSVAEARRLTKAFKAMLSISDTTSVSGAIVDLHGAGFETNESRPPALGDLEALSGVATYPVRIKCATLSWNALLQALDADAPTGATEAASP